MKTEKLLLTMALPMAFAACTNENLIEDNSVNPGEGNLVELDDNFVLTGKKAENQISRGVWESIPGQRLQWSWLPKILGSSADANSMLGGLNVVADEIGLCWTGELADGSGSISSKVYTNYQFRHDGWLAEDQDAADIDCEDLKNGKFYNEIITGSLSNTSSLADIKNQLTGVDNEVTLDGENHALNLNTGVFKTENKAIFGGSYIVYYPYNPDFKDASTIPAESPVVFDDVKDEDISGENVGKNTYLIGYANNLIGGAKASNFSLNPLSAIMSLQLSNEGSNQTITKIALISDNGFVTNVSLDASKVKAMGASAGESLYVTGSKEVSKTLIANIESNKSISSTVSKFYLPVLPTTTKNLKAIVYTSDKTAIVDLNDVTFEAGKGTIVSVKTKDADFKDNIKYAVDFETLNRYVSSTATENNPLTVNIVGDIELKSDLTIKSYITVSGGNIIVPEEKTLAMENNSTLMSNVVVEGESCCSNSGVGGNMVVKSAVVAGNVTVEASEKEGKANGAISFEGVSKDEPSKVETTSTITVYGDMNINKDKYSNIYGTVIMNDNSKMNVSGAVNFNGGKLINNAEINVADGAEFNILDAKGQTDFSAGVNFTNNGTFIDQVGAIVGGATQFMTNNGDYICEVADNARMTEAYEQKLACNIIDIISTEATTYSFNKIRKHEYKGNEIDVDIIVSGNNVKFLPNESSIIIGNLTIAEKEETTGLRIETSKIDSKSELPYTITVNGDINAFGNLRVSKDVYEMKANNLYVRKNSKVSGLSTEFDNREDNTGNTLVVAGTIEVEKDATFTIKTAGVGANIARVTCTKLIEGGTFNGKPIVVKAN